MKIANVKVYQVCDRSEFIEIEDEDIAELRAWKAYPYTGETAADLAAYVAGLSGKVDEDDEKSDTPQIAINLFYSLWSDVSLTQMWDGSFDKPESSIVVYDDDNDKLGEADSTRSP